MLANSEFRLVGYDQLDISNFSALVLYNNLRNSSPFLDSID